MKHWTKRGARVSACGQVTDGIIRRGDVALLTQNAAEVTCELCKHAWDFPLPTPRRMPKREGNMARRLTTIAKYINEHVKGLSARTEKSWSSTDRKYAGSRLRFSGKGRSGTRLIVYVTSMHPNGLHYVPKGRAAPDGVVLDFDNSETYRTNSEVEEWLDRWERLGRWEAGWSRAAVLRGDPWKEKR